ncbi:hypothetical protein [Azospirillum doebereinerae]|uniref:hypothetical protein n=1 Tax=Azospirillum doebereinerae TaxID=92933 RepID=UPI00163BB0FE|nr:hypothetical protein [Azospirillum doebereinerae]MCG5243727.1 hypothetical protein [Azospirillum doebereinerae]
MSSFNATSFETAAVDTAVEPQVRKMHGLPRAAVWVFMIGAPWVVIVQAVRLFF